MDVPADTSYLDLLTGVADELERYLLPDNQTVINIIEGRWKGPVIYRRLLRVNKYITGVYWKKFEHELNQTYLLLPDGQKSRYFSLILDKLAERLIALQGILLDAETSIMEASNDWLREFDEQVKAMNLLRAYPAPKPGNYEQWADEALPLRISRKPSTWSFRCLDSKGELKYISYTPTKVHSTFNAPNREEMDAMKTAISTLEFILGITPHRINSPSTPYRRIPAIIKRITRFLGELSQKLSEPTRILIAFKQKILFIQRSELPPEQKEKPSPQEDIPKYIPLLSPPPLLHLVIVRKKDLLEGLREYVEQDEHLALENLILNGITPPKRITVNCLVKEFGITFAQANSVHKNGAKTLSDQIPKFFLRNDGGKLVEFSPENLVKYLRGDRK